MYLGMTFMGMEHNAELTVFIGKERVVSYSHKCVGTLEKRIVGTLNPRTFRLVCHRKTQTVFLRLVTACR